MRGWGVLSRWADAERQGFREFSEGRRGVGASGGMGEMTEAWVFLLLECA